MATGSRITLSKYSEGDRPTTPEEGKAILYIETEESTGVVNLKVKSTSGGYAGGPDVEDIYMVSNIGILEFEESKRITTNRLRTPTWTSSPQLATTKHTSCIANTTLGTVRELIIVSEISDIHYVYVDEKSTGDVLTLKIRTNSIEDSPAAYVDFECPNNPSPEVMLIEVRTLRTTTSPFPINTSVWKEGVRIDV